MRIGISGAHRTGKTTLAQELARHLDVPFLPGSVTPVFEEFGLKPTDKISFKLRMDIQLEALYRYISKATQLKEFVTDRTPVDFIAYTLAEMSTAALQEDKGQGALLVENYIEQCYAVASRTLDMQFIVPPAIEIEHDSSKALCEAAFIQKLHALVFGTAYDPRMTRVPVGIVPHQCTDLTDRVELAISTLDALGVCLIPERAREMLKAH